MQTYPSLYLVLINGLIDSFNPCAISILLLFIALTFLLVKNRSLILILGLFYIISIYLTYLLIGLGILKIVHLFGTPHFMGKLGAWLIIIVGLINLKDYFSPRFLPWLNLRISIHSRQLISEWVYKARVPAAIIVGFLVGICEFPCSGAIYLTTIGLLSIKTTFWQGFFYLLLYNLMFVLPLILIYLLATSRLIVEKMIFWQESRAATMRLISALLMLTIGVVILVFFV